MEDKIRQISRGRTGKNIIEVLEGLKTIVADVRTPMKIQDRAIENTVRLAVIEAIDTFFIDKMKVYNNELERPEANEYM